MTEIEKETGMTDVECEYWDKHFTNQDYKLGPNLMDLGIKPGMGNKILMLNQLDKEVAAYLRTQAETLHKSSIQIINELVREKIAVGA